MSEDDTKSVQSIAPKPLAEPKEGGKPEHELVKTLDPAHGFGGQFVGLPGGKSVRVE